MEYKIIIEESPQDLEEQVNKYLADGWILQGGISISRSQNRVSGGFDDLVYAQAMVKKS